MRHIESHHISRQGECVLSLGPAPRFLSASAAGGVLSVFVEDDFNPRPREPWTVVAVTGNGDTVPDRSIFVGSTTAGNAWWHVYAYRGAPRKEISA
ncbi:hypothetical protein D3C87_847960 [compost metagenome]